MKFSTTWRLLLAVLLLGGAIWLLDRRVETTDQRRTRRARLLPDMRDDVDYLRVEKGDLSVECVMEKGAWWIHSPLRARAGEGAVDKLLSVLERLRRGESIPIDQVKARDLTLADYGLGTPRARIVFRDQRGQQEVIVGDPAPLGEAVFVRIGGSDRIVSTGRELLDALPDGVEDLRDRRLLHGDLFSTTRLEIQRPGGGFVQLTRSDGQWRLQQPVTALADSSRISSLLDVLFGLEAAEFVWDPPVGEPGPEVKVPDAADSAEGRVEAYGFADETALRITVWVKGDDVGKELLLGKTPGKQSDLVYATRRDLPSIYLVDRSVLDAFEVAADDLRDRRVFTIPPDRVRHVRLQQEERRVVLQKDREQGWVLTEPVQWKADDEVVEGLVRFLAGWQVLAFRDALSTNLEEQGLDPPRLTVCLAAVPAAAGREDATDSGPPPESAGVDWRCLRIGRRVEGRDAVVTMFEGGSSMMELREDAVRCLPGDPADPLYYRERTMLAVAPGNVKRLTLSRGGDEQSVVRNADGMWVPGEEGPFKAATDVVRDILFYTSNLRALRVECHNPESLPAYGLDSSGMRLTLGLSGKEGIQKSLLMGFRSKMDGIYAMVQGQGVVFVLANDVVDRLTGDLLEPLPETTAP